MILKVEHCYQLKIKWHMVIVRVCGKCMATLCYTELLHSGWKPFVRIRMLLVIISMVTTHKDLLFQVIAGSERILDDMPVGCGGRDK
jgi:ABC-type antimicrobial peptide transport system ATPase subunit